jgi:flagellar biosynthetic protein FliR
LQTPGWQGAAELLQGLMMLGLQLAMPLILFLLLMDLALGILARVVPQLNIFVIGTTVKTALGMLLLGAVILSFAGPLQRSVNRFNLRAVELLRTLNPDSGPAGERVDVKGAAAGEASL